MRLDQECRRNQRGNDVPVIHCYGHGGSGVTLSVGCAHDVVNTLFTPWFNQQRRGDNGNNSSSNSGSSGLKLSDWMKYRSKL